MSAYLITVPPEVRFIIQLLLEYPGPYDILCEAHSVIRTRDIVQVCVTSAALRTVLCLKFPNRN